MPVKIKLNIAIITVLILVFAIVAVVTACSSNKNNTSMPQGDSGSGETLVQVPDLLGYSLEELQLEFDIRGITSSATMLISEEPKGTVLYIDKMGLHVPISTTLEVLVSWGLPDWDDGYINESGDNESDDLVAEDLLRDYDPSVPRQLFEVMEFGGIDWLILEEKEDKVLLISEFVLFDMQYNEVFESTTWETSEIRRYLNDEFYYSFSLEDRERIAETKVINGYKLFIDVIGNGGEAVGTQSWPIFCGNDTDDKVFILSHDEQKSYFKEDNARLARMAEDHPRFGMIHAPTHWWWLRSPFFCTFSAYFVAWMGLDYIGDRVTEVVGVRPALWLYVS